MPENEYKKLLLEAKNHSNKAQRLLSEVSELSAQAEKLSHNERYKILNEIISKQKEAFDEISKAAKIQSELFKIQSES